MDSLDAQSLLVDLFERESRAPDLWRHGCDGGLACAYAGGQRTFSWGPEAVAEMAARWRSDHQGEVPEATRAFIDAHVRVMDILREGGLSPPDHLSHDFPCAQITLVWEEEKLVVVVDEVGVSPVIRSSHAAGEHQGPSESRR
jgi:hypothetical protein